MSMIGNLACISEEIRQTLHQNPSLIQDLLYGEAQNRVVPQPGFFARLLGGRKTAQVAPSTGKVAPLMDDETIDLDKTWHVLHFLFTGTAWEGEFPANFLVSGGQPVGEVDVGYGPARSFSPVQVREIHSFLQKLDLVELRSRMVPKEMMQLELYPSVWREDTVVDDEWRYFVGGLETAKTFMSETTRQGKALLVYIN